MARLDVSLREEFDRSRLNFPKGTPFWKDSSFQKALKCHPQLKEVVTYLPPDLKTEIFYGQAGIEALWSSYKDHGYGYFFYALARVLKPKLCVEIGVLQGFSLFTVASALRDNGGGMVIGFDLFEDYPYHHENYLTVLDRIKTLRLENWAKANRLDAFEVHKKFRKVDLLHVDISNNGDTYLDTFEQWANKVNKVMLFEGGSVERDKVDWMIKYKKPPITKALDEIRIKYPYWSITVLNPYPSLTVATRVA